MDNLNNWPLYFSDTVYLANKESNIGIICLWTKKERLIEKIDDDNYCFIGNLYSKEYGLQILIRNLLSNPRLDSLIVTGVDLNDSAKGLINLFEKGITKKNKVKGTDVYLDSQITEKYVLELKKRIKLVDLRKIRKFDQLNLEIKKLIRKKSFKKTPKKIIIPLPKINPPVRYPTDYSGFKISAESFFLAYQELLKKIIRFGMFNKSKKRVMIQNVIFFVKKFNENDKEFVKSGKSNSWIPKSFQKNIYGKTSHCSAYVDRLDCWNDIKDAAKYMYSKQTKNIAIMIGTAYLLEKDLENALETVGYCVVKKWETDSHGNLVIRVENERIRVMHLDSKGSILDEFEGVNAKEINKKIASESRISLIYHALDIGAELQKAEICLQKGKRYVQDKSIK